MKHQGQDGLADGALLLRLGFEQILEHAMTPRMTEVGENVPRT
jgi:hypothetical protein